MHLYHIYITPFSLKFSAPPLSSPDLLWLLFALLLLPLVLLEMKCKENHILNQFL